MTATLTPKLPDSRYEDWNLEAVSSYALAEYIKEANLHAFRYSARTEESTAAWEAALIRCEDECRKRIKARRSR